VLTFAPPLNVTEEELNQAWTMLAAAISEISDSLVAPTSRKSNA
jgi:hypothetical protein